MNELVFIESNKTNAEPFTTSKVIAEVTGIEHRKLKSTLQKHIDSINTFGLSTPYEAESSGGRPEIIYKLNEQQATFLITLLKNTDTVVKFKVELVRQFYTMREELMKRSIERAGLNPIRRELTDIIQETTDSRWAYKQYTDLAYKMALGKNASKIRAERNAPKKAKAIDYLSADEINLVAKMQYRIAVLLEMGMDYTEVKTTLLSSPVLARVS